MFEWYIQVSKEVAAMLASLKIGMDEVTVHKDEGGPLMWSVEGLTIAAAGGKVQLRYAKMRSNWSNSLCEAIDQEYSTIVPARDGACAVLRDYGLDNSGVIRVNVGAYASLLNRLKSWADRRRRQEVAE